MKFSINLPLEFKAQLDLPLDFCQKARDEYRSKAKFRTCLGTWKIKVGKYRERFYLHGEEWNKFVKKHHLHPFDFLRFDHAASFHFTVTIYGPDRCLKDFPSNGDDETMSPEPLRLQCKNPSFIKVMTALNGCGHQKKNSSLTLPSNKWWSSNLKEKKKVILRVGRKEWAVDLVFSTRNRVILGKGWFNFVTANNIKKGDACKFQIILQPQQQEDASSFRCAKNAVIFLVTILANN